MRTHTFHLSDPEETEDNPWEDVEAFLRRIASENPTRGQYAIVEKASDLDQKPAGQEHPDHYVLFGIFHTDEDDGDQIVIETFPHPEDAQFWDTVDKPVSGPTIVAADSSTDPAEQGSIATVAAASWGTNPWILSSPTLPFLHVREHRRRKSGRRLWMLLLKLRVKLQNKETKHRANNS